MPICINMESVFNKQFYEQNKMDKHSKKIIVMSLSTSDFILIFKERKTVTRPQFQFD